MAVAAGASAAGLAALLSAAGTATAPPARAFGTVNWGGQRAEHERITRAALGCRPGQPSDGSCFEPYSLDQLAGRTGTYGGVGSPDLTEITNPRAHCDDADYLDTPDYPRTRDEASDELLACVEHLRYRHGEARRHAFQIVDFGGRIRPGQVDRAEGDCAVTTEDERAKCRVIIQFGKALHGVQDFYAHSNWADRPDPGRPLGADNPPGLGRTDLPALLDLAGRRPTRQDVPRDLSTGCFSVLPFVCGSRITHSVLNKDTGLIDPRTGVTSDPTTPRGKVLNNFDRAVQGAIQDTWRQWQDLRAAIIRNHGEQVGGRIVCAIARDNPVNDCA
jgi:hypothetical protein